MTKLENAVKGLECCLQGTWELCKERPYHEGFYPSVCKVARDQDALDVLKDSGQDEGWLCEKRTSGRQPTDLLCACGNKVYFTTLLFKDGFTANELFCPNCGLSMRSPHHDKDGVWLRKHWEEVVLKEREPRVMTLEEVKNAEIVWIEQVGHCVPAIKIRTFEDCKMMFAYSYDDNIHTINIVPKYYNRISRCWTSRPTYEQRKAVKWDG